MSSSDRFFLIRVRTATIVKRPRPIALPLNASLNAAGMRTVYQVAAPSRSVSGLYLRSNAYCRSWKPCYKKFLMADFSAMRSRLASASRPSL